MTRTSSKPSLYQKITDQVIAAIEAGAPRFEMPWHYTFPRPTNISSGKRYRGINVLALWMAQQANDYRSGVWGTYKQWSAKGAQVRKGERATTVVFFKDIAETATEDEDTTTHRPTFVATASWVFNAEQVHGYEASSYIPITSDEITRQVNIICQVEDFVTATGARIQDQGDRACYNPHHDTITMPPRGRFTGTTTSDPTESYYSTLLHELTHWTGHSSRLNRFTHARFGDNAYAMEELVAELGAAFLCADLQVSPCPRPDHAAYLQGWLKVLRQDTRAIFTAAAKASAACDYLCQLAAHS